MKRKRYTEPQIVFALQQAEGGMSVAEICRSIIGFRDLWMLKAALDDCQTGAENANSVVDSKRLAA